MAFSIGSQIDKQYLNLSTFAYDTIKNDMLAFDSPGLSTFINKVFQNFYPNANASIFLTLERKRGEWMEMLKAFPNKDDVVGCLLAEEAKRLQTEATGYPKDCAVKIRLNNKNYNYLTDPYGTCCEERYYRRGKTGDGQESPGMYIKAVLEEYAGKSFLEREAIYFHEQIDCIQDAISRQKQLKIKVQSGAQFYVRPYAIVTDRQSAYHYLVGLSHRVDQDDSLAAPFSFRVARVEDVTLCKSRSGFLSSAVRRELERLIAEKGASFVGGDKEIIRVRLTDKGNRMYKNILHLRPQHLSYEEDNGHIYTFECTPSQIKFYFTRFGRHAQILSPESLSDQFRYFYRAALEAMGDELGNMRDKEPQRKEETNIENHSG